jgi:hypothetical protein
MRRSFAFVPIGVPTSRFVAPADVLLVARNRRQYRAVVVTPARRLSGRRLRLSFAHRTSVRACGVTKNQSGPSLDVTTMRGGDTAEALMRQRARKGWAQPSWTGDGTVQLSGKGERTTPLDVFVLVGVALAIDLVAYGISSLFGAQVRIVCGQFCFPAPAADLHDARVRLWAAGIAVAVSLLIVLVLRRARIAVAVVQLVLLAALVAYTIPTIVRAHDQTRELQRCDYGRHGPCIGLRNLGTPTGT